MTDRKEILKYFENPESDWLEKANERLEKYRKGEAGIIVIDKNGNPVKNTKIKIKQKNHSFRFGANIFMLDELETAEKNGIYKEKFAKLFNMATLPFYWCDTEPEKGKPRYAADSYKIYRRPPIDLCLQFCAENGIEPREHALAYDCFFPDWLKGLSIEQEKEEIEQHFKEIASLYSDKINTIEVTNEMFWDKSVTEFYKEPDFVEWCFKMAKKYFSKNCLAINEYTESAWGVPKYPSYYAYLEKNMAANAPIDAIGLQYHIFCPREKEFEKIDTLYNPSHLSNQLELYSSSFGLPQQITEITIPAYSNEDTDEEIQAKTLEYLYTVWFSSPKVEQIIYWNLVDGYAAFTEAGNMSEGENKFYGGLLRFDMSEKPAYKTLDRLLNNVWHTDLQTQTDNNGKINFCGFYGDYEVEISVNGEKINKEISLSPNSKNEFTVSV